MKIVGDHVEFEPNEVTLPLEGQQPRGLAVLLYPEGTTFIRDGVRYIVRGGSVVRGRPRRKRRNTANDRTRAR